MQTTLDLAREGGAQPVDKKDETVHGTLPLFKLRSKADREKWSEGGLVKDHTFPLFLTPSLISLIVVSFFLADGSLLGPFS